MEPPAQISQRVHAEAVDATSYFEFWPTWLMYLPVMLAWPWWALRYRSLMLPFIANPSIFLAGMVGGSKEEVMSQTRGELQAAILPWCSWVKNAGPSDKQARKIIELAASHNIHLPFVCKPDTGCRGAGVKCIHNDAQLASAIECYSEGAKVIIQQLADYSPEVGIFFVRDGADQKAGRVVSLTFKETPHVTGDGKSTLCELVSQDARMYELLHLYQSRNQTRWQQVIAKGETVELLFSASHCRGAVFTDAREHITPALNATINRWMADFPEFNYGRMDVKYANLASLKAGQHLQVVEINGASSESIHIWDKNAKLLDALKTLLWQYRTLFVLGNRERAKGKRPPNLSTLIKAWRRERALTRHYPETD